MFNRIGLKLVILSMGLLAVTDLALACDKHKNKAGKQTKFALASGAENKDVEIPTIADAKPTGSLHTTEAQDSAKQNSKTSAAVTSANPDSKIQVLEFVLTNQIVGREPKDTVETYGAENRTAYAFARLSSKENAQVTFLWFKDDKEHSRFTTNVQPASKWRTNASIKLNPGQWKVQLLSDGQVLAERSFTVQ